MSDLTLPVWSFRPDWSGGMSETLEWSTSVVVSNSGSEQRRSLRLSPRRTLATSCVVVAEQRQRMDLAAMAGGSSLWNVPLYFDQSRLTAAAAVGAETVTVSTQYTEFAVGGLVYFRGKDEFSYEVRQITAMDANSLTLDRGLLSAWPKYTRIYPMKAAQFADQPQVTKKADEGAVFTVNWQIVDTNDYPEWTFTEFYLGYPVFRARPDETSDLTVQYTRLMDTIDSTYSLPRQIDLAGFGFTMQQYAWFLRGRQQHSQFRSLLYALRGRITPVWLPTFFADMTLVQPIVMGDQHITIKRNGISDFFTTMPPGRRDIILDPRGAGAPAVYRRITSVINPGDGTEVINVDTAFDQVILPSDLKRISFLSLARLSQDSVEITHNTDNVGVAQCVGIFQSTPETRINTDYNYDRFPDNVQSDDPCICGSECGAYGDSRNLSGIVVDPSITYTTASSDTLAAYRAFLVSEGYSEEDVDSNVASFQAALDATATEDRADMLSSMQQNVTPEYYALLEAMSDADLHVAFTNWYAWFLYEITVTLSLGPANYVAAQLLASTIPACEQDQVEDQHGNPQSLLATFCASIKTQTGTQDTTQGNDGTSYPMGFTIHISGRGTDAAYGIGAGSAVPYPVLDPDPGSLSGGLAFAIGEQIILGYNPSGTPTDYLQPGCGAVAFQVMEAHTGFFGAADAPNPDGTMSSKGQAWSTFFNVFFVSRDVFPDAVIFRTRNQNGQIIGEQTVACYSEPITGGSGVGGYLITLRNYPITTVYYPVDDTVNNGWHDDPDLGNYHFLPADGNYIFDILTTSDPIASEEINYVSGGSDSGGGVDGTGS